jgi:hypothetical protein
MTMAAKMKTLLLFAFLLISTPASALECNDDQVIDQAKLHFVCQGESKAFCDKLGLKTYLDYQNLSDEQIKDATMQIHKPLFDAMKQYNSTVVQDFKIGAFNIIYKGNLAARDLFNNLTVIPTDYDPNLQRYTCHAHAVFNKDAFHNKLLQQAMAIAMSESDQCYGADFTYTVQPTSSSFFERRFIVNVTKIEPCPPGQGGDSSNG